MPIDTNANKRNGTANRRAPLKVADSVRKETRAVNMKAMTAIQRSGTDTQPNGSGHLIDNAMDSLQAISTMCLPEALNVVPLAVLQECLLGQLSLASYRTGNNDFLPLVVKDFNLRQVLNKTTKKGGALYEDALTELQIHAYIQRKQVRQAIGLYAMHLNRDTNRLCAYLEYAANGDLFSILQARGTSGLPLSLCGAFFVQLLQGIDALHQINVVHRDLSLENVLLTQDNQIKICDFGLAAICVPGQTIHDGRAVGKVNYMCPELFYGEEYDPRMVDIWSAAVIFFVLLTGVFPYERPSLSDPRLVLLCHGKINEMLTHWKRRPLDQDVLQVFSNVFCPPQQRATAKQLLDLPFCQRYANVSKAAISRALTVSIRASESSQAKSTPISKSNLLETKSSTPCLCRATSTVSSVDSDSASAFHSNSTSSSGMNSPLTPSSPQLSFSTASSTSA